MKNVVNENSQMCLLDEINALVENLKNLKNKLKEQNINVEFHLYLRCSIHDDELIDYNQFCINYKSDAKIFNYGLNTEHVMFDYYQKNLVNDLSIEFYFEQITTYKQISYYNKILLTKI